MSSAPSSSGSRISEPTKILLGLVVGAALGATLNAVFAPAKGEVNATYAEIVWLADNVANPVGQVFLRLLFMVVVPLVFCSITLGVASIGSVERLGRLGARTVTWFIGTTAFAVALGLLVVNVFRPGALIDREKAEQIRQEFRGQANEKMQQAQQGTGFSVHTFVNIIPRNVFRAASDDRETLGVIFFALIIGIAVMLHPSRRRRCSSTCCRSSTTCASRSSASR
jgi:DAACS family dicarboxylate/amino acid:cation (Na+ or H+) symporter